MKRLIAFILIGSLVMLAGCIDYEEVIMLNKDGSGTIKIHYALDKSYIKQMEEMSKSMGGESSTPENIGDIPSETEVREQFDKMSSSSVKLISYRTSETDGWQTMDMELSFESMSDLSSINKIFAEEGADSSGISGTAYYEKQPDGNWLFKRDLAGMSGEQTANQMDMSGMTDMTDEDEANAAANTPDSINYEQAMKEMQEAMKEMPEQPEGGEQDVNTEEMQKQMAAAMEGMQAMFAGMEKAKLKVTVKFPGKVMESNATKIDGNTAVWDYSIAELGMAGALARSVCLSELKKEPNRKSGLSLV